MKVIRSNTLRGIDLKGWEAVATTLQFCFVGETISINNSIEQMLQWYFTSNEMDEGKRKNLRTFMANRGIKSTKDLLNGEGKWRTTKEITPLVRSTRMVGAEDFVVFLNEVTTEAVPTEDVIVACAGWEWLGERKLRPGWKFPNKTWYNRIVKREKRIGNSTGDGTRVAVQLIGNPIGRCCGEVPNKSRMTIWRIVQHGFFTNNTTLKWKVSDGICTRYVLDMALRLKL